MFFFCINVTFVHTNGADLEQAFAANHHWQNFPKE